MKTGATKGGSFFRTMVLMGSSVAVGSGVAAGCGGSAELVPGTGGGPSTGGSPGAGGSGTGGGTSSGGGSGGIILGDGGSTASGGLGGLGGAFPTDCPTTQLSCEVTSGSECGLNGYLVLPAGCECDSERPASADDCDDGEVFSCLAASVDARGDALEPLVQFNCECVTGEDDSYCQPVCDARTDSFALAQCDAPNPPDLEAFLCGCALTILK